MAQKIGYNDGLDWFVNFVKKFPLVKYRPVGDRPPGLSQWYGLEKLERTLRILKDDHDAAIVSPAPVPDPPKPPDPPPATKRYAPRTHNLGSHNQDPRFCMRPEYGVVAVGGGYIDEAGCRYDESGMNTDGLRDRNRIVAGLRGADDMNGLEPCDTYVIDGQTRPPYPPDSYLR